MAIGSTVQSGRHAYQLNGYIADKESDVANLPTDCAPGSKCEVAASGNVYILNNERKWVLFNKAGSGGGGGSTLDADWGTISGSSNSGSLDSDWGSISGSNSGSQDSSWGTL